MTIAQLNNEILAVVRSSTETEMELTPATHLIRQMGLTSVELMMLVSDLEDRFCITIPTDRLRHVQTVADLQTLVMETIRDSQ